MTKHILALIGSASNNSSNLKLVERLIQLNEGHLHFTVIEDLRHLPHFDPSQSAENPPDVVAAFRAQVANADAVLISTPEYIFSIPSILKNALEWCVASTVFTDKPVAIITASAHGARGHEELQMIIKTLGGRIDNDNLLLVQGVRGKMNENGILKDELAQTLLQYSEALRTLAPSKAETKQ